MNEIFEPHPRWPGAGPVCVVANLPAFKSLADAAAFHEANNPHGVILCEWRCRACQHYHHWSGPPTNTNGEVVAGGDKLPARIAKLIVLTRLPE